MLWQFDGHPGVAALVLGGEEPDAGQPRQRIPPEQATDQQFQPADPVIAANQVGQLVDQQGRPPLVVQPGQQRGREEQPGPTADGPEQRRHRAGDEPYPRTATQAKPVGQVAVGLPGSPGRQGAGRAWRSSRWKRTIRDSVPRKTITAPATHTQPAKVRSSGRPTPATPPAGGLPAARARRGSDTRDVSGTTTAPRLLGRSGCRLRRNQRFGRLSGDGRRFRGQGQRHRLGPLGQFLDVHGAPRLHKGRRRFGGQAGTRQRPLRPYPPRGAGRQRARLCAVGPSPGTGNATMGGVTSFFSSTRSHTLCTVPPVGGCAARPRGPPRPTTLLDQGIGQAHLHETAHGRLLTHFVAATASRRDKSGTRVVRLLLLELLEKGAQLVPFLFAENCSASRRCSSRGVIDPPHNFFGRLECSLQLQTEWPLRWSPRAEKTWGQRSAIATGRISFSSKHAPGVSAPCRTPHALPSGIEDVRELATVLGAVLPQRLEHGPTPRWSHPLSSQEAWNPR